MSNLILTPHVAAGGVTAGGRGHVQDYDNIMAVLHRIRCSTGSRERTPITDGHLARILNRPATTPTAVGACTS